MSLSCVNMALFWMVSVRMFSTFCFNTQHTRTTGFQFL